MDPQQLALLSSLPLKAGTEMKSEEAQIPPITATQTELGVWVCLDTTTWKQSSDDGLEEDNTHNSAKHTLRGSNAVYKADAEGSREQTLLCRGSF